MSLQLGNSNAVVTAHHFNPSIVNQIWLVDHDLVGRDEFQRGCVFSDMLSNAVTKRFVLFVAPEQLQFTPIGERGAHQALASSTLGKLVELLPHTPYSAFGLNFTWHLRPESDDVATLSRRLFFDEQRPLYRAFATDDARFGGYLSKEAFGCRMKLDVKPITAKTNEEQFEIMQFAFNFHLELAGKDNAVHQIQGLIDRWDEAFDMSREVLQFLEENES